MSGKERLEQSALIAEVLGGIAVVVSVIYLAIQISDNNRLLQSQAHYNALDVIQRPYELALENDEINEALADCAADPRNVEAAIWRRCRDYWFLMFNGWEYAYYQNLDGSIPTPLWDGINDGISFTSKRNPVIARYWEQESISFGEPFKSYVEDIVSRNEHYTKPSRDPSGG